MRDGPTASDLDTKQAGSVQAESEGMWRWWCQPDAGYMAATLGQGEVEFGKAKKLIKKALGNWIIGQLAEGAWHLRQRRSRKLSSRPRFRSRQTSATQPTLHSSARQSRLIADRNTRRWARIVHGRKGVVHGREGERRLLPFHTLCLRTAGLLGTSLGVVACCLQIDYLLSSPIDLVPVAVESSTTLDSKTRGRGASIQSPSPPRSVLRTKSGSRCLGIWHALLSLSFSARFLWHWRPAQALSWRQYVR